jgi:hypothetical protein
MRTFGHKLLVVTAAVLLAACGGSEPETNSDPDGAPGGFDPSGAYTKDCFWGPATDPNVVNVLYPDKYAIYWTSSFHIPLGGHILLKGEYPAARYMSFNAYNPLLQPIDALADSEIVADAGSTNTALAGADRMAEDRSYTIKIVAGVPADISGDGDAGDRQANTLYSFQGRDGIGYIPSNQANVIYRVYVPDEGRDQTGSVGLPRVVLVLADGTEIEGTEGCEIAEPGGIPPVAANLIADSDALPFGAGTGGFNPPQWLKFFNLQGSQANRFNATPLGDIIRPTSLNPQDSGGGFASNAHNGYIYSAASQNFGEVFVMAAQYPRTPTTLHGDAVMGGGDMRYWSLCTNDRESQRWVDCYYDEQTVPMNNDDGSNDSGDWRVFLVSPGTPPSNANQDCDVNPLGWGFSGESLLIQRNMLPEDDYQQAIQFIPGAAGHCEAPTMGSKFPYSAAMSKADFESLGCGVTLTDLLPYLKATQFDQNADNSNCKEIDGYDQATRPEAITVR